MITEIIHIHHVSLDVVQFMDGVWIMNKYGCLGNEIVSSV